MVTVIVQNHLNTDWGKDWRIPRVEQRWIYNYIVDKDKDYEVIGVTYFRVLDEKTKDYKSEFRIYKDDILQKMFTSKYFETAYFGSYNETLDDLEKALVNVKKDGEEGSAYENIKRYTLLSNLVTKYHQGWSLFFSEEEYRENRYEDYGKDDGVIAAQLDNLYSNFSIEKHFINTDNTSLTKTFLALTDPENKFKTTRFTITTILGSRGECAICKNLIIQYTDAEVELPCTHKFHLRCLFQHMVEIQACRVCHIFVILDKDGKILNPYSNNPSKADESLMRCIPNKRKECFQLLLKGRKIVGKQYMILD
jgi:hypothetical protein